MLFLSVILAFYIIASGILPTKLKLGNKIALSAFAILISLKFFITKLITGKLFFEPDIPKIFIIGSSWLFGILFILFFLFIFKDIIFLPIWLFNLKFKKINPDSFKKIFNRTGLILTVFAIFLASIGLYSSLKVPEVKVVNVAIDNLPANLENFSIAVLSDLHIDRITDKAKMEKIVQRTNETKPDLIVLLGDYADGSANDFADSLQVLANLKSKFGTYGIVGNHEYYSGYSEYLKMLNSLNIKMLLNQSVVVANNSIFIAGVTDQAAASRGFRNKLPTPNLNKAMQGSNFYKVKILLAHRPSIALEAKNFDIDLQLSGHTHGGSMLLFKHLVAKFNDGFVANLYHFDDSKMQLYVSNGTGIWNGFPFRIGVPSEITLIKLKRSKTPNRI